MARIDPWFLLDALVGTLMLMGLPLAPLLATLIEGDARHLRRYPSSLARAARHVAAIVRARVVSRNLSRALRPADPDTQVVGACTHCGRCCAFEACVFLTWTEGGRSRCSIYGSRFFNLLSCGRYPVAADDVEAYGCPSFAVVPRRTIPIAVAPGAGRERHMR